MKIFKDKLTTDDLVLISMLNFPNGVIGEETLHRFIYNLTEFPEFKSYRKYLNFETSTECVFSTFIHRSIEANTKHLKKISDPEFKRQDVQSFAMFSDELRELYWDVFNKERKFSEYIPDYYPKVFFLSNEGKSIASLVAKEKLNDKQKKLIRTLANL
jgi:hypothetical protein